MINGSWKCEYQCAKVYAYKYNNNMYVKRCMEIDRERERGCGGVCSSESVCRPATAVLQRINSVRSSRDEDMYLERKWRPAKWWIMAVISAANASLASSDDLEMHSLSSRTRRDQIQVILHYTYYKCCYCSSPYPLSFFARVCFYSGEFAVEFRKPLCAHTRSKAALLIFMMMMIKNSRFSVGVLPNTHSGDTLATPPH